MPRPATKAELIEAANGQFEILLKLIDSMTDGELNTEFNFGDGFDKPEAHWKRDKNLRDVLVHLYEWHRLLLDWVDSNLNGDMKPFLPEPYNWKTYGGMNMEFWMKHQSTPYADALEMLRGSHNEAVTLAERFSDTELFTKKYFPWVGTPSLGSYFVSATSSHCGWAIKKIKLHIKTIR